MTKYCPHCRQVLKSFRVGVVLTPLKAGIFDVIKEAGDVGITSAELLADDRLFHDRRRKPAETTVKAHCWQLNELLEATPFIIVSDQRRWFLERRQRKVA